ncbi:MAG: hypothetical protein GXY40_07095 [Syntrophomonadaceae bacterium]|nr:hypothetical protein [Syntrophomonadaceae bacterium]
MNHSWVKTLAVVLLLLFFAASTGSAYAADLQLYVKEPTAGQASPYPLGKSEPKFGALLGSTFDRDNNLNGTLSNVKSAYGKSYSSALIYVDWGEPIPYLIDDVTNNNASLQLSIEPNQGLQAVNDNQYLRQLARQLREFGNPVFLRFAGEMNGDWTAWGMQPELYKEKFRLVADVMHRDAPNVAMVWSPNYVPDDKLDSYYPGDAWVDWVGINGYADYYFVGNPQNDNAAWTWTKFYQGHKANPLTKFKKIYNAYSGKKPIMISETGVAWANSRPYQVVDGWAAQTLKQVYGYIPLLYPRIKAVYYFNSGIPQDFSIYNVSQNSTMTQAYREAIASPYYLDTYNGQSPFYYCALGNRIYSEICDLACYVDAGETNITAVEYYVNGQFMGRSTRIPWDISCRFPAGGGNAVVEARALNSAGAVVAHKSVKASVPSSKSIKVTLDGQQLSFDEPPGMFNNRVMIPLRAVSEQLGFQVSWDNNRKQATVQGNGTSMTILLDQQQFIVNGQTRNPEVAGKLINGRVLVPVRYIGENLGLRVSWDAATNTAILTR